MAARWRRPGEGSRLCVLCVRAWRARTCGPVCCGQGCTPQQGKCGGSARWGSQARARMGRLEEDNAPQRSTARLRTWWCWGWGCTTISSWGGQQLRLPIPMQGGQEQREFSHLGRPRSLPPAPQSTPRRTRRMTRRTAAGSHRAESTSGPTAWRRTSPRQGERPESQGSREGCTRTASPQAWGGSSTACA